MLNKNTRKSFCKKGQNIPVSKPSPWMQTMLSFPLKGHSALSHHDNLQRQQRFMSLSCHFKESHMQYMGKARNRSQA